MLDIAKAEAKDRECFNEEQADDESSEESDNNQNQQVEPAPRDAKLVREPRVNWAQIAGVREASKREPCGSDPDSGECADSGCGGLLSSEVIRKGYRWSSFTILQSLLHENAQARHAIALLLFRRSLILRAISAIGVCAVAVQGAGENLSSVGFFHARHLFGRALSNDAAALFAAFGAEINDPVGLFDDVEIMLDDQYRVAERDKAVENVEKFFYIVEMQPGGGLIENV